MTLGSAPPRISQSSPWLQPAFWQRYGHWLLYLLALSYICLSAMMRFDGVEARLMLGDNDDLMRLVSLRDWLGGQGWYDSHQYRLLPPEGVQMHWSRYVDAGLAALYLPLAQIMPNERAILWLVTLWPSLLWALAVLITGQGSRALLGNWGALAAVLAVLTWGKISSEFQPGRIDHHNLQIMLGLAIFYLAVLPERPKFYGVCAGVLTAASLAIGLEMLPYLAMIWFMAVLRHALNLPGSRLHLIGFACGVGLAAPLLMAGQLPIALWSRLYCDILALPVLGLIALGIIATLAPVALEARITKPWLRIFLVLGVALLGLAAFWPLLGACARGPYAMIAPETQEIIDTRITEGMAIGRFFQQSPVQSLTIMLPVALTLLGFGALLVSRPGPRPLRGWHRRFAHLGFRPATEAAAIGAIFLTLASFLLAMTQIRAANLMAPSYPFLLACLITGFIYLPKTAAKRGALMLLILASLPITTTLLAPEAAGLLNLPGAKPRPPTPCRSAAAMAEIQALPPHSLVFTTLNLGAAILSYSTQSATSAPYHRSNDAFWNGVGPFEDETAMIQALQKSSADVLLLCATPPAREAAFLQAIRAGQRPDWLGAPLDGKSETLIYPIIPEALVRAAQGGAP